MKMKRVLSSITAAAIMLMSAVAAPSISGLSVTASAAATEFITYDYDDSTITVPITKNDDGGVGGTAVLFSYNGSDIKYGETTVGELKEMYTGFQINGLEFTSISNSGINLSDVEYQIFVQTGTEEKPWSQWDFVKNTTNMNFATDIKKEIADTYIVYNIGILIVIAPEFTSAANIEAGTTLYINMAAPKDIEYTYDGSEFYIPVTEKDGKLSASADLYKYSSSDIVYGSTTIGDLKKLYSSLSVSDIVFDNVSVTGIDPSVVHYQLYVAGGKDSSDWSGWYSVGGDTMDLADIDFGNSDMSTDDHVLQSIGVQAFIDSADLAGKVTAGDRIYVNHDGLFPAVINYDGGELIGSVGENLYGEGLSFSCTLPITPKGVSLGATTVGELKQMYSGVEIAGFEIKTVDNPKIKPSELYYNLVIQTGPGYDEWTTYDCTNYNGSILDFSMLDDVPDSNYVRSIYLQVIAPDDFESRGIAKDDIIIINSSGVERTALEADMSELSLDASVTAAEDGTLSIYCSQLVTFDHDLGYGTEKYGNIRAKYNSMVFTNCDDVLINGHKITSDDLKVTLHVQFKEYNSDVGGYVYLGSSYTGDGKQPWPMNAKKTCAYSAGSDRLVSTDVTDDCVIGGVYVGVSASGIPADVIAEGDTTAVITFAAAESTEDTWQANFSYDAATGVLTWDDYVNEAYPEKCYRVYVSNGVEDVPQFHTSLNSENMFFRMAESYLLTGDNASEDRVISLAAIPELGSDEILARSSDGYTFKIDGGFREDAGLAAPADVSLDAKGNVVWKSPEGIVGTIIIYRDLPDAAENRFAGRTDESDGGLSKELFETYGSAALYMYSAASDGRISKPTIVKYDELEIIKGENTFTYIDNGDGTATITGGKINDGNVVIPAEIDGLKVTAIGDMAFSAFIGEAGMNVRTLVIPEGVTKLGRGCFYYCINLTEVSLPDTLEYIDNMAFERCYALKTITIPASVTTINGNPFAQNTSMTSIACDSGNKNYVSVDGVLFTKDMNALVSYPAGKTGEYTVPASVNHIGDAAFSGAKDLEKVTILGTLDFIGFQAFSDCTKLTDVRINDGVAYVGYWAFTNCTGIKQLTVPQSVVNIGDQAFGYADYKGTKLDGFTLRGYKDSAVYFYAIRHEIPFISIGDAEPENMPFDEDKAVDAEIEPDPNEGADSSTAIKTITVTPTASMMDKGNAGVGLDISKIKVKASAIYDDEGIKRAETALGTTIKGNKNYSLLDLALYNGDTDISDKYDGLVQIAIPIPPGHKGKTFYVYRINDNGEKERIPGRQTETEYLFYLEHFSMYVIVADEGHECEFGETWINDKDSHWHECSCGKIDADSKAAHTASDWIIDKEATKEEAGSKHKECTVCGYILEEAEIEKKPSSSGGLSGGSSGGPSGGGSSNRGSAASSLPEIGGAAKTWSSIAADIAALTNGAAATIELNGNGYVPADVIRAIADKDAKVTFVIDSRRSWTVDGAGITAPEAINAEVIETRKIDSSVLRGSEGFEFYFGGTDLPVEFNYTFAKADAGKFANLYIKTADGFAFVDNVIIDANGKASGFDLSANGSYVIMVCDFSDLMGDANNDGIFNSLDASAILKDIVVIESVANPMMADFNCDGTMNAKDVSDILKVIVGSAAVNN